MQIYFKNYTFFYCFVLLVSPVKSPFKKSMMSNSFYGKHKTIYLTPLERKAIKESLPSPPSLPPPLPPLQEKKKQNRKGGKKQTKAAARTRKMGIRRYKTSAKTLKHSQLDNRFVFIFISVDIVLSVGTLTCQ